MSSLWTPYKNPQTLKMSPIMNRFFYPFGKDHLWVDIAGVHKEHLGVHNAVVSRSDPGWPMVIPLINRRKNWAGRIALGELAEVSCYTNTIQ